MSREVEAQLSASTILTAITRSLDLVGMKTQRGFRAQLVTSTIAITFLADVTSVILKLRTQLQRLRVKQEESMARLIEATWVLRVEKQKFMSHHNSGFALCARREVKL